MKNAKKLLAVALSTVVIGCASTMAATTTKTGAAASTLKIGVVNVPAVVEASSEVKALKKEQQTKIEELQKWLKTVKADVDKQKTQEEKEALIKKYDADFVKKQEAIRSNYAKKLQAIDKHISTVIDQTKKDAGYDLILTKASVLSGGTDITSEISKKVK